MIVLGFFQTSLLVIMSQVKSRIFDGQVRVESEVKYFKLQIIKTVISRF